MQNIFLTSRESAKVAELNRRMGVLESRRARGPQRNRITNPGPWSITGTDGDNPDDIVAELDIYVTPTELVSLSFGATVELTPELLGGTLARFTLTETTEGLIRPFEMSTNFYVSIGAGPHVVAGRPGAGYAPTTGAIPLVIPQTQGWRHYVLTADYGTGGTGGVVVATITDAWMTAESR